MTYMGANRRATVDKDHPDAFAICDRCGFLHNHKNLRWQMEWRGRSLVKTGFLVCNSCLDVPHELDRAIKLPPDPVPIKNPRGPQIVQDAAPPDIPVQQIIEGD